VKIVGRALSSLAIAQLTDGKIMATYVYGTRPFALSTTTTASGVTPPTFTQPFLVQWTKNNLNNLDLAGSTKLTGDDISAITAADGYATIVFTNQTVGFEGFYAARHRVGDTYGTGNFFGTRLSSGADSADNHISLVTDPTAGATSAVYAVVKTSLDDAIEPNGDPRVPNPADPLLKVMKLQPRSGGTALTVNNAGYVDVTQATISTVANKGTRPVVSLDNSRRALDVFYSAPSDPAASSNVIGVINHKAVDLGTFTPDVSPTVVAANSANNAGVTANQPDGQSDPSVAAQILNKASGTVFVSSDTRVVSTLPLTLARRYWFNDLFRAPSAAFTSVIPTEAGNELGLKVNFTDTSLGRPTSWAWNFGDGGTSTSATPSHTYLSAGSKTVTLTVDNGYQTSTVTKTVVVGQAPQARFTARFPDKQKLLIELTDVSVGAPNSIRWTFGDGTSRTLTTPGAVVRHPYAKAGTYKVTLTVTNPVGSSTVDHPTTKVTTYSFVVNATPAKVAKPTRTALTGRKVVVGWKAPNPRGLVITKYQAICRAPGSVRSTTISAKDGTAALGKARKATVSLLTTGKTYSCTVKSFNAKGWSLPSVASTTFKARA
jgi:PKD repeat protein